MKADRWDWVVEHAEYFRLQARRYADLEERAQVDVAEEAMLRWATSRMEPPTDTTEYAAQAAIKFFVRRTAADLYRKHLGRRGKKVRGAVLDPEKPLPEVPDHAEHPRDRIDLGTVDLSCLTPDQRRVVEAIYFRGLTSSEYADECRQTKANISLHHVNALTRLRKHYGNRIV